MADIVFDEDTITGEDPNAVVTSAPGIGQTWETNPSAWETLVIGGLSWPGQWDIEPSGEKRDIDKKKAKGTHGQTIRDQGMIGGTVSIKGTITAAEYPAVKELIQMLSPRRPKSIRTAITISHPDCDLIGLNEIYIEDIIPRGPKTGKDFWTVTIMASQWFPEPKDVKEPVPKAIVSRAEALRIFQGLEQKPGPQGPQPDETFAESIGRLADRANYITSPDQVIPPVTEP